MEKDPRVIMSQRPVIYVVRTDAFIFIDGNFDFVDPAGALFVAGLPHEVSLDEFIANSLKLFRMSFGLKACSYDSHPPGHIEHRLLEIVHCLVGTPGEKYHPRLMEIFNGSDMHLPKGMDMELLSYSIALSPMFHYLVARLRTLGITRVFIAGLAFNYCVVAAAIALADQGFEVFIVRDATRSVPHPYGDEEDYVLKKIDAYRNINIVYMDQLREAA